jgi:Rod binding domain-containing protein
LSADFSQISALQSVSAMRAAKSFAPQTARDVPKEFEAFVLQSFIQEMLPKNAEGVYGSGIAGDIWRSMLSEQLAFQVAERGGIGIADQVRGAQALKAMQGPGATGASGSVPAPAAQEQNPPLPETPANDGSAGWRTIVERS